MTPTKMIALLAVLAATMSGCAAASTHLVTVTGTTGAGSPLAEAIVAPPASGYSKRPN